jgi:large subunit ribosomal protein L18
MAKVKKQLRRQRVKRSIRGKVKGDAKRPRLTVFRSNKHIYAQLIDDREGNTLASASSLDEGIEGGNPREIGKAVGMRLAAKAKEKGIEGAVFDRNGYRYHGRIQSLADGAREGGLRF